MIEIKLQQHMLIQYFDSPDDGTEVAIVVSKLKPEIEEWLKERLDRNLEAYLTGDDAGNWYYAISFKPEENTIAVEFKIRWS
jgi:hypothetical protein